MARVDRVKRRLLHDMVRENLDTIRGLPRLPVRRSYRLRRIMLRGLFLLVALVAPSLAVITINALSTGGGEWRTAATPTAPVAQTFPAPQRLNAVAFPLGVKKIVLDPGHGGTDSGARTQIGLWEKEITLDIARRLRALLQDASFDVVLTRDADESVSLQERALFANAERGDLFLSIHVNAIPTPECHVVETFYLGPTNDPRIERLAGAENRESGYSLADFRRLLEGVYAHVRQAESKKLAEAVQGELVAVLGHTNPAIRDNGVKTAPFLVLVAAESPGILAEVSCLSDHDEARLLADPGYRQKIAWGLFLGLRAYVSPRDRPGPQGSS